MKFSSVVSYHTNPMTCGVAKFNSELARRLGVPVVGFEDAWGVFPLLSWKWSEVKADAGGACIYAIDSKPYGVFWHDAGNPVITANATHVFYADPSLGSPGLWCPSLIAPRKRPVRLFSFGMAHKLQTEKYKRVRELLDAAGLPFHLRVSVGLHEGTSLDGAEKHFDALRDIMGPENATILGCLSDDAVSEEFDRAHYVLAFFEHGLRANNTTVHAAHEAGKIVVTNWDGYTHHALKHGTRNIDYLEEWPGLRADWHSAYMDYSWEALIEAMDECVQSKSQIA